jgi:ketosteroid isomerase-like protein
MPDTPMKQTLVDFFQAVNRRDLDRLGHLLTEQAEFYFPKTQPLLGKDRILKFFAILFRQYPELSFDMQRVIIENNKAAAHWKNRGLSRKKTPYENEGVTILEFEGNRICFISDFFKDTEKF